MEKSVKNFLSGKSRRAYSLREDIARGLKDDQINSCTNDVLKSTAGFSCSCRETLERFTDMFNNMLHTGTALVKRASEQQPKKSNKKYRDLKKQNEWLLENVFDIHGNYLFCVSCIIEILNVHASRLHRLRKIKREQANILIRRVRKQDVQKEQIQNIVPPLNVKNVLEWWMCLENDSLVDLRTPPRLHQGRGNNRKEQLLSRFLNFIDTNSQPNGRQVGSHGPLFFLSPKFYRINAPSKNDANKSEEWKRRSLVYEFNRTLDGESISNGTAKNWLKKFRPKHAISPLRTDYCPMCAECQEQKKRAEAIFKRLQENGNSNEEQMREYQILAESYWLLLAEHKMEAARELKHYRQQANDSRFSYLSIQELQQRKDRIKEDRVQLQKFMDEITFTLSLDYQQSKLTPHWGFSAQPGDTYYLRKLSHHIFGIVDHAVAKNTVYVTDERICAKNGDLTISLMDHYIQNKIPPWVRHLCLYMDNGPTNKNQFMIQYGIELVQHKHFDTVKFCFLVAGHAKFDPDRLFSRIAHAYNHSDVFITDQLVSLIQNTIEPMGECISINNRKVVNWKQLLKDKYGPFENLKKFREFLIKRDDHGNALVFHKACCYEGNYLKKQLLKSKMAASVDLRKRLKEFSYYAKNMGTQLLKEKIQDLCKMFDAYIDPKLRPEWLPTAKTIDVTSRVAIEPPSAALANKHREELKKKARKKKKRTGGVKND